MLLDEDLTGWRRDGKGILIAKTSNPAKRKGYLDYVTMHVPSLAPAADTINMILNSLDFRV